MGCLYIHVCLKMQLCLKMRFSTSFEITYTLKQRHIQKTYFFSFHSLLFLVNNTVQKMKFSTKAGNVKCDHQEMWPNPQFPMDFLIFTDETLNGKLHFLCSVIQGRWKSKTDRSEWDEKCHYASDIYFLNGPMVNLMFYYHIMLY